MHDIKNNPLSFCYLSNLKQNLFFKSSKSTLIIAVQLRRYVSLSLKNDPLILARPFLSRYKKFLSIFQLSHYWSSRPAYCAWIKVKSIGDFFLHYTLGIFSCRYFFHLAHQCSWGNDLNSLNLLIILLNAIN